MAAVCEGYKQAGSRGYDNRLSARYLFVRLRSGHVLQLARLDGLASFGQLESGLRPLVSTRDSLQQLDDV